MEIKKMVKKIAAISTGALMLGATLTGALAYSLAEYPAPFLKNGMLDNTVIVVGKAADTADVMGAIEIAAALQAEATSVVSTGGVSNPTISAGVKIEKTGDKINYGVEVGDIQSVFDDADLPVLLPGGTLKSKAYTETLTLSTTVGEFRYASPGKSQDRTFTNAGNFLYFPTSSQVYEYVLEMDSQLNKDASELEGASFMIQGNTYTISDVAYASSGAYTEITLMAGEAKTILHQDEPYSVPSGATVVLIDSSTTQCYLSVDGVSGYVSVGDTDVINNVQIGVISSFSSDRTWSCEVTLGADKLILKDGNQVDKNGEEVEGSMVTLVGNNTAGTFDSFTITYAPDKDDFSTYSDYYAEGDSFIDPVFSNFKIYFDGVSANTEEMTFSASSDQATFTFNNVKGDEVEIPFYIDGVAIRPGYDTTSPLVYAGGNGNALDMDTYPDTRLWYVLSNGEVHVLEFNDYDDDTQKIEFEDLTTGRTLTTSAFVAVAGATESVTLGSLGSINLGWTEATNVLNFTVTGTAAETEFGAEVLFVNASTLSVTSPDEDSDVQGGDEVFTLALSYDVTDDEITLLAPATGGTFHADGVDKVYKDGDDVMYVSEKGIMFEYDDDEDLDLTITYPEEDVYANVFIAPTDALVSAGTATGDGVSVNPFAVGLAKQDVDAEGMTANMIVVGGPCANTIAFEIMGSPAECGIGFEEGIGMLKFFERKGKAALLVAGYEAQETVNAAYVLAQHNGKYASKFADLDSGEVALVVQDMSAVVFRI